MVGAATEDIVRPHSEARRLERSLKNAAAASRDKARATGVLCNADHSCRAGRPCNEAVEMIDHEKALGKQPRHTGLLADVMGDTAWQPTFVFYMGYPTLTGRASPRRPIAAVVL